MPGLLVVVGWLFSEVPLQVRAVWPMFGAQLSSVGARGAAAEEAAMRIADALAVWRSRHTASACSIDMNSTIKVSSSTRDLVKELADADGVTLDAEPRALARRERQRRMGLELAADDPDAADAAWLDMGAAEACDASR